MPNTNPNNQYSVGLPVINSGGNYLPLGSFCSGGTFTINSLTDSTNTNCANMFLAMDGSSLLFTANYPYPNLECTVNFKCNSDGSISSDIVVVSNDNGNSWP
jgi:hypothetical protein